MDWWPITPQKYSPGYIIEWSPSGHVRSRYNHEIIWQTTTCSKAAYAESLGYSLLKGGSHGTTKQVCAQV